MPCEVRDLLFAEAEFLQHRGGMLADVRRCDGEFARRARERERLASMSWRRLALDGLRRLEMLHLRIGEHLVDLVDRAGRHAGFVEHSTHSLLVRVDVTASRSFELVAMFQPFLAVDVFGLLHELLHAKRIAQPRPHLVAGGRDVDVAIRGFVNAGRRAGRMIVAGLPRHFAGHQPARALEIEHENLRLQQRGLHVLALAGFFALQQRRENAERRKQSGAEIGNRDADAHRSLPRQARDRHQPAHALRDLVEARAAGIRAGLAETGDRRVDEAAG